MKGMDRGPDDQILILDIGMLSSIFALCWV
jgi:hypothetical protein